MSSPDAAGFGRVPGLTACLAALTVAAYLAAEPAGAAGWFQATVLDRTAPKLWPMFGAHLLHTDLNHLSWNLGALIVLAWSIELYSRRLLIVGVVSGMAGVSVWFFLVGDTPFYCGWSGALNSLLLCALYSFHATTAGRPLSGWALRTHHAILVTIGLGVLAKHVFELKTGTALVSDTAWPPAPGAHIAGWLTGGLLVSILVGFRRRPDRDRGASGQGEARARRTMAPGPAAGP